MPNRIIKESIRESYSIDLLSADAEVTFYRLLTYADDFGIFKSDPRLVNKAIYPLKTHTDKSVANWLNEIAAAQMVVFYICEEGKPYGIFSTWQTHNSPRNKKSKHPRPNRAESKLFNNIYLLLKSIEINCKQMKSIAALIQSNPNPNPNPIQSIAPPPVEKEVVDYFLKNGFSEQLGKKAFKYYNEADPPWTDTNGKKVKAWKQKMVGNWFKNESKSHKAPNRQTAEPSKYGDN